MCRSVIAPKCQLTPAVGSRRLAAKIGGRRMEFAGLYRGIACRRVAAAWPLLLAAFVALTAAAANARPYQFITHVAGDVDYWPRFSPDGKTILFSRCEMRRCRLPVRRTACRLGLLTAGRRTAGGITE